jgi:galactoside O-acetyltransferase
MNKINKNLEGLLKSVGDDVFISDFTEFKRPHLVSIGNHVAIDSGFYITTGADIGDYIHISPQITVIGGETVKLTMEGFNTMAAGCRIVCASDEYLGAGLIGPIIPDEYRDNVKFADVTFKKFSSIGTNAVVLPGVTLGEGSVVGACSLVNKDTEPWTIYVGVPARPLKLRQKDKMIEFAKRLGYF